MESWLADCSTNIMLRALSRSAVMTCPAYHCGILKACSLQADNGGLLQGDRRTRRVLLDDGVQAALHSEALRVPQLEVLESHLDTVVGVASEGVRHQAHTAVLDQTGLGGPDQLPPVDLGLTVRPRLHVQGVVYQLRTDMDLLAGLGLEPGALVAV